MSGLAAVTLRDGSKVPQAMLTLTTVRMKALMQKSPVALFDLVEKCRNVHFEFIKNPFCDSKALLTEHALVDQSGAVNEDVQKIVLNSIEGSYLTLKLVDPLQPNRIKKHF
ncbi:MAG: hypothetical protein ABSA17_03650 [Rhabdochlamydiaceae bacterium]|jgi:hypothetical protein